MDSQRPKRVWLAVVLALVVGGALVVTLVEGAPGRLPGVALGSTVLLHAERAVALFALGLAVLTVLIQAAQGRLPTQLSTGGLGYETDAAAAAGHAVAELQHQVEDLEETLTVLAERVDAAGRED